MLIEQIITLELRGPGHLAVYVLLQLVNFMTKQKSPRDIFEWISLLFTAKILQYAMYLTYPYLSQITCTFNHKTQNFVCVLT